MQLQLKEQPASNYQVNIFNHNGQKESSSNFALTVNKSTQPVPLNRQLPAGIYTVEIINAAQTKTTLKLMLQ